MRHFVFFLLAFMLLLPLNAHAVQPGEMLKDPAQEARARALSAELRCMVCQNESIDDSDAPLAHDLRVLVREHIKAGESNDQIRKYLVDRYGDFILLKPPFKAETVLLWGTPILVLIVGIIGIGLAMRRRTAATFVEPVLNGDEEARIASLLKK